MLVTSVMFSFLTQSSCQKSVGKFVQKSQCQYHVVDQTIALEKPVIYDVNVGRECPKARFGQMHLDMCTDCSGLDNQCGGEFVACAGCCDLPKKNRYHSCENIKKYFFERNSQTIQCDARYEADDGDLNVYMGPETTHRDDKSGTLTSTCDSNIIDVEAKGVPMKLKFDCTGCAVEGSPDLLRQCCDKAEAYQGSVTVRRLNSEGKTVFVWADGCHDSFIGRDKNIDFMHRFPALKEEAIDEKMREFIDVNYCSKARDESTDTCARRLRAQDGWSMESQDLNASQTPRRLDEDCEWLYGKADSADSETASTTGLTWPLTAMLLSGIASFSS